MAYSDTTLCQGGTTKFHCGVILCYGGATVCHLIQINKRQEIQTIFMYLEYIQQTFYLCNGMMKELKISTISENLHAMTEQGLTRIESPKTF